jgi:hypothetical protein
MSFIGKLLSYPRGLIVTIFMGVHTLVMSIVVLFLAGVIRNRHVVDFGIKLRW